MPTIPPPSPNPTLTNETKYSINELKKSSTYPKTS